MPLPTGEMSMDQDPVSCQMDPDTIITCQIYQVTGKIGFMLMDQDPKGSYLIDQDPGKILTYESESW